MPLPFVTNKVIDSMYAKDSFIRINYEYIFKNPLWNKNIPGGASLCPYFWMSIILGLICVRSLVIISLVCGTVINFVGLSKLDRFLFETTFNKLFKLNPTYVPGIGSLIPILAVLAAYIIGKIAITLVGLLISVKSFDSNLLIYSTLLISVLFGMLCFKNNEKDKLIILNTLFIISLGFTMTTLLLYSSIYVSLIDTIGNIFVSILAIISSGLDFIGKYLAIFGLWLLEAIKEVFKFIVFNILGFSILSIPVIGWFGILSLLGWFTTKDEKRIEKIKSTVTPHYDYLNEKCTKERIESSLKFLVRNKLIKSLVKWDNTSYLYKFYKKEVMQVVSDMYSDKYPEFVNNPYIRESYVEKIYNYNRQSLLNELVDIYIDKHVSIRINSDIELTNGEFNKLYNIVRNSYNNKNSSYANINTFELEYNNISVRFLKGIQDFCLEDTRYISEFVNKRVYNTIKLDLDSYLKEWKRNRKTWKKSIFEVFSESEQYKTISKCTSVILDRIHDLWNGIKYLFKLIRTIIRKSCLGVAQLFVWLFIMAQLGKKKHCPYRIFED